YQRGTSSLATDHRPVSTRRRRVRRYSRPISARRSEQTTDQCQRYNDRGAGGVKQGAAERGVASHTEFASDLPRVDANMNQLREVISNLVQNAMEAMDFITDRQRILTLKTKLQDGGTVMVEVQDTGTGIDPKRLDSIFEAFVSTKSHGIGLGLALCRMIVERHDGRLTALSD